MSYEELDRVSVIERVIEKRLTQREAARMLGLTSRQVRRLRRAYGRDGPGGLASKHRGRPGNRRLSAELRREALGRAARDGPRIVVVRLRDGLGSTDADLDSATAEDLERQLKALGYVDGP